eukprot:scaffold122716_cov69-Phaeocystis_antarctica.AAC.1
MAASATISVQAAPTTLNGWQRWRYKFKVGNDGGYKFGHTDASHGAGHGGWDHACTLHIGGRWRAQGV